MDEIKTWEIIYENPTTGERVKSHEIAATKAEARKKARESNIRDEVSRRFWKIVAVKEVTL